MNSRDEKIRNALTDSLTQSNVDIRNLAVDVVNNNLVVKGTVPSEDQRAQLELLVRHCVDQGLSLATFDVSVIAVAPSDSADGLGRSPMTGPSADSAHESRHQLDKP